MYYNHYSDTKQFKNLEFHFVLALMLRGYNPITLRVYSKNYYEHITNEGIVIHKL